MVDHGVCVSGRGDCWSGISIKPFEMLVMFRGEIDTRSLASLGQRRKRTAGGWAGAGRKLRRSLSRHDDVGVVVEEAKGLMIYVVDEN